MGNRTITRAFGLGLWVLFGVLSLPARAQYVPPQDALRWSGSPVDTFEAPTIVAPDLSVSPSVELAAELTIENPHGIGTAGATILLPDLFSGVVERRSLDLAPLAPLPTPVIGVAITGVTERSTDGSLFFIDAGSNRLLRTDPDGILLDEFPLASPLGGILGDLTYVLDTDSFWAVDLAADVLFEFDAVGLPTGQVLPMPGAGILGTLGNGVAAQPSGELFVPSGRANAGRVETLHQLGEPSLACMDRTVAVADWTEVSARDPFLTGVAWHPGLGGDPTLFVVGAASRTVMRVRATGLSCQQTPPCDFSCVAMGTSVFLAWQNNDLYDSIEIYRDGVIIATVMGSDTSFVDVVPQPGEFVYALRSLTGGVSCLGPRCLGRATDPDQVESTIPGASTPWGITVVESSSRVYVSDLDTGTTSRFDLGLGFIDTIPSPAPGVTGVTWRPASNTLYWVTDDELIETDLDGGMLGIFPLENPGEGTVGGLTLTCDGTALLFADIEDDSFYAVDFTGVALSQEPVFYNSDSMMGSGAYGAGVARLPDGSGYISTRGPRPSPANGPTRVVHTNCVGATTDAILPLGAGALVDDPFVTGVALVLGTPSGLSNPYLYAVESSQGGVVAIPLSNSSCSPPTDLVCNIVGGSVELSWTNGGAYTSITVTRNCVDIGTYGSGTTSHIDSSPLAGSNWYTICCECPNGRVVKIDCHVCYDNNSRDLIVHKEDTLNGETDSGSALRESIEATGRTVAVFHELQGKEVDDFRSLWVSLGTFPDNNALTPSEGVKLAEFLISGKPVYLEGGDLWGFDAPTVLFDYDGVDGLEADGNIIQDGDDTFRGMFGENFRTLTLAGLGAPYLQEQLGDDRTDRLVPTGTSFAPDVPGLGAAQVWSDDGTGGSPVAYGTGIFYQPATSGSVISVSWEFGGYDGDRDFLMRRYLGALGLIFVRGDVNGDAMVNIGDAISLLDTLFGATTLTCLSAADANDSGAVDIADPIHVLSFLFSLGAPPAPPFPDCGPDPSLDAVPCGGYPLCP